MANVWNWWWRGDCKRKSNTSTFNNNILITSNDYPRKHTCSVVNKGQLLYQEAENQLDICLGSKWQRATSGKLG